ncbi:hypothetical protein A3A66_01465 [Microgenomates group bacterium RIFCSPLOWO2_01_FULL_46_13]|nr:MAG: hypothetical protein A2783_00940 [Microgenomates group bacterium RIFCSPHIGHO2_01_FULL_45_11]OGV94667.1 MAG: hypothetical protein A3A66_01465 [Microgenomates group bacterium RIFCSPLOWO2_01_FULL_46_13]
MKGMEIEAVENENEPSLALVVAFDGFLYNFPGYEVKEENDYPPSAMGGSRHVRYELENGVVVERCTDPVMQGTLNQFTVKLPSGEWHCFFREVRQ